MKQWKRIAKEKKVETKKGLRIYVNIKSAPSPGHTLLLIFMYFTLDLRCLVSLCFLQYFLVFFLASKDCIRT